MKCYVNRIRVVTICSSICKYFDTESVIKATIFDVLLGIAKRSRVVTIIFVVFQQPYLMVSTELFFSIFIFSMIDDHSPSIHLQLVVSKCNTSDLFSGASRTAKAPFLSSCIACRCFVLLDDFS